ncbi:hypothetical protein Q31b_23280 [Novipirellula aureliae]|uniref:Uncharacterized protein n=1 Tax=Novipirellula aureliae TaxID=2527966 RepID=A0A5C6E2Z9_9BACT|nr:hypothetical protein [Novipirellula aureliae]TWU43290.1 hypothetical protein Q31b_23280 [Novipirellula aureliae]
MVRLARSEVFDPHEVVVGHLYNRTCRRCFLMGNDQVSGKNFDHRKIWIEKYLQQFAEFFSLDLLTEKCRRQTIHWTLSSKKTTLWVVPLSLCAHLVY